MSYYFFVAEIYIKNISDSFENPNEFLCVCERFLYLKDLTFLEEVLPLPFGSQYMNLLV